jgi:3-dehydroquinate synthase
MDFSNGKSLVFFLNTGSDFDLLNAEIQKASQVFILADENTAVHCVTSLQPFIDCTYHLITWKVGEPNKTMDAAMHVWAELTKHEADRNVLLINVGGGVIGDIGGFAAGCYKRGIRYIQLPTSLLAMVDSSVGGKTGVDFNGFKNHIGLFNSPSHVFVHLPFLKTLPPRELLSGFAEVVKHYLIADKKAFLELATPSFELKKVNWLASVQKSIAIKSKIVEEDYLETNARKSLNFGHTLGHAIESFYLDNELNRFLHGEAIAVGMVAESYLSYHFGLISEKELSVITSCLRKLFPLQPLPETDFKSIISLVAQDKKNSAGQNRFTLLKGIGNYSVNHSVEEYLMQEALRYFNLQIV